MLVTTSSNISRSSRLELGEWSLAFHSEFLTFLTFFRHYGGVPLMVEHIRHLGFSFWIEHLSHRSWSPLWSALLATATNVNTTSTFLFPYINEYSHNHNGYAEFLITFNCHAEFLIPFNCLAKFLIPFNLTTPSTSSAIQNHFADYPFQCTNLDYKSTFSLFSDFLQNLPDPTQIIITDASKSSYITSIASYSELGHLAY